MKKIISFSLWGENKRYTIGALQNIKLAEKFFSDWIVKIYYNNSVPNDILLEFKKFNNVELKDMSNNTISPYFWRFYEMFISDDNIILSRDVDSRLSLREYNCVDSWINSDKKYFVIRDHPRHYDFPMLAGMWGVKGKLNEEYFNKMLEYGSQNFYTIDQVFLRDVLWENIKNDSYIIGIYESKDFNNSRNNILPHFVGQGYDEYDVPIYPTE